MYLLAAAQACPAYLFGILGSLLLLARPGTGREWLTIVISIAGLALWFQYPDSLTQQTIRVSAAVFVVTFVVATVGGLRPLMTRAMLAVLVAALVSIAWFVAFHIQFATLEHELVTQTWQQLRAAGFDLPAVMPTDAGTVGAPDTAHLYATRLTFGASIFPAILAVAALVGARLAWSWYHRIARTPLLAPAEPFRSFRFNDHLIWLVIVAIGVMLLAPAHRVSVAALNTLVVVGVLYALRGAAVFAASLVRVSRLSMTILVLMLLPLLIASVLPMMLAVIGVADTWLDFRRRMAPPTGVPS